MVRADAATARVGRNTSKVAQIGKGKKAERMAMNDAGERKIRARRVL